MNWLKHKSITYVFPFKFFVLAAVFHSVGFAYAACVALALGYAKEGFDRLQENKVSKVDEVLRHKVEQMEAALSAIVTREKARGW